MCGCNESLYNILIYDSNNVFDLDFIFYSFNNNKNADK